MRISDWSSDVCSSDLFCCNGLGQHLLSDPFDVRETQACKAQRLHGVGVARSAGELSQHHEARKCFTIIVIALAAVEVPDLRHHADCRLGGQSRYQFLPRNAGCADTVRSEEHTSELQSLMRISYAVFCLKKKTKN